MSRRCAAAAVVLALVASLGPSAAAATTTTVPPSHLAPPASHAQLVTPVLSARRLPTLLEAPIADAHLLAALAPIVAHANPTSCLEVELDGRRIDDVRGSLPLMPASTEKLLTASALLAKVGPDATTETVAAATEPVHDGVLDGDLYVVGGGDPLLETTGYQPSQEDPDEPYNDFAKLAAAIKAAGITAIHGNVIGDESRFDTTRYVPSWPGRYITAGESGPLSALMVNGGFTGLTDHPQAPSADRQPGNPPLLAAATLVTLLRQRGVQVTGGSGTGRTPSDAHTVAALRSLPLSSELTELLRRSDNTTAELLAKELGHLVAGSGSTAAGARAVQSTLTAIGMPMRGTVTVDGSGLDLGNRVTCDLLTALLVHAGPDSVIARSLPVAGRTGTLRFRLTGTVAEGRVAAKTGTLDEVNALAGFAHSVSGQTLVFAFIINGTSPTGPALLDQAAVALARYGSGLSLAQLGPEPAGS
ncbi:MAG TPA: D-alanyl-D-alanine carboxypeptidase/D-alanyl-D-alanine-endopeptidase [Acidimicrobiales bacterium]|nr:D-alanyl-D-alanine carboxypeptidase/D-alanyl-D-alanine-endopeptidase [Acidimicrobiales bacterium]